MKPADFRIALADLGRFLTFRATAEDYNRFGLPHFLIGLCVTWLVGIARNWDFNEAILVARLGLVSVAYIFFMGLMLWLSSWPPSSKRQSYQKVLTVVAMTAPPGLVYGIPVEMFMPMSSAQAANLAFLGLVALWRVALVIHFFIRGCENRWPISLVIVFLPITILIMALVATGRAGYVMDIMGGMRETTETAQKAVDDMIALLFCFSWPALAVGLIVYISAVAAIGVGNLRATLAEPVDTSEEPNLN